MRRPCLVLVFSFFLIPRLAWSAPDSGEPCWSKMFAWNNTPPAKSESVVILPFENFKGVAEDRWIAMALPLLLNDYLSLSKKVGVIPPAPSFWQATFDTEQGLKIARSLGAHYLVVGRLFRDKGYRIPASLQVETILLSVGEGKELKRVNGLLELPLTRRLNEFLTGAVEEYSQAAKNIGLKRKNLLPFLHQTSSPEALRFFTAGTLLLYEDRKEAADQAIKKFEEAIKQDYNYVPGYLGLAQALVSAALVQRVQGEPGTPFWRRARVELEKARLLHPPYTKARETIVLKYLEAYVHQEAAASAEAQGKGNEAVRELQEAARLLPGDLKTRQTLVQWLNQTGRAKEDEEKAVLELTSCGN